MRSPRTYQDTKFEIGDLIELDKIASHHLYRVLRLKDYDNITLFNGDGYEYSSSLVIQGKKVFAKILNHTETNKESNLEITLLQGVSKGDRMDMCIQKSVELGVNKIIPVICQRTVVNLKADRLEKKMKHWQGIIISACEQSGRNIIPDLERPIHLQEVIKRKLAGTKLTLQPMATQRINDFQPTDNKINFLIGPEGGLTDDEIKLALDHEFSGICLGKRILRTETAAIAAISAAQTLWGDF